MTKALSGASFLYSFDLHSAIGAPLEPLRPCNVKLEPLGAILNASLRVIATFGSGRV